MRRCIFSIWLLMVLLPVRGQKDSISVENLETVYLFSPFRSDSARGFHSVQLRDSAVLGSTYSLTDISRRKFHLFCKEYGKGMIANVSSGGAYASHMGVYWNGIPLNSALNGQTDFNVLSPGIFEQVSFFRSGGSVMLGSGAMSGAINLQNRLVYEHPLQLSFQTTMGSFHSQGITGKMSMGSRHWAGRAAVQFLRSENDYPFPETELTNENGQMRNFSYTTGISYRSSPHQEWYVQHLLVHSDRHLSRSISAPSHAGLLYDNRALLTGWKLKKTLFTSDLNAAYVQEIYQYTPNRQNPENRYSNRSGKWMLKEDFRYELHRNLSVVAGTGFEYLSGEGDNILSSASKTLYGFAGWSQSIGKSFRYHVQLRKEWNDTYRIPLIAGFDARWELGRKHVFKTNISSNFRRPTLNDLYWTTGGNPGLLPEKSYTGEVSYTYRPVAEATYSIGFFRTRAQNLIQWRPGEGGLWSPVNVRNTDMRGLTFDAREAFRFDDQHKLSLSAFYRYTRSVDMENGHQLMYIPLHYAGANMSWKYRKWTFGWDYSFTGKTYTTSTNTQFLPAYSLHRAEVSFAPANNNFQITGVIKNIFDQNYFMTPDRPMPGRNYELTIRINY